MRVLIKMLAWLLLAMSYAWWSVCILVGLAIYAPFWVICRLFDSVWGGVALIVLGMAGAVWLGGLR
jgi:hypothetical protein